MSWSRTYQLILAAAKGMGVVCEPISADETDFFMRLRWAGRSVIISKTRSPFLTQVAQTLSNNKHVSREQLTRAGVPVVEDCLVDDVCTPAELAELVAAWMDGGVMVKPNWGNRARGVAGPLQAPDAILAAVVRARALDRDEEALLEPYLEGVDLRVAVVGGQSIAATQIQRPSLVGDGLHSAAELIDALNRDPRRGRWVDPGLQALDAIERGDDLDAALGRVGLRAQDVLPEGTQLTMLTEELETIDRTDEVHPAWMEVARTACQELGIDVGGVDLRGPWDAFTVPPAPSHTPKAVVLEVNALPALHLHALPTQGRPRPVFEAFVAYCVGMPDAPAPCARVQAKGLSTSV